MNPRRVLRSLECGDSGRCWITILGDYPAPWNWDSVSRRTECPTLTMPTWSVEAALRCCEFGVVKRATGHQFTTYMLSRDDLKPDISVATLDAIAVEISPVNAEYLPGIQRLSSGHQRCIGRIHCLVCILLDQLEGAQQRDVI